MISMHSNKEEFSKKKKQLTHLAQIPVHMHAELSHPSCASLLLALWRAPRAETHTPRRVRPPPRRPLRLLIDVFSSSQSSDSSSAAQRSAVQCQRRMQRETYVHVRLFSLLASALDSLVCLPEIEILLIPW
jgi:hypothetical protein